MTLATPAARERALLLAAIGAGLGVRLLYVLLTRHLPLVGDGLEYDVEGRFIALGHWWWTFAPYGIAHASAWKAPAYPAWVGAWYWLLGHHPLAVRLVQLPLGGATIALTWLLARRLFGPRTAIASAFAVALYPLAWQYEGLLYSESFATPLTIALLIVILTGKPTPRRAALAGGLLGLGLLLRPTSILMLAPVAVAFWIARGPRAGTVLALISAAAAVAVVAPWTIRNAVVEHGFIPISIQDAAAYGTFNADAAHDPLFPYAWRPLPPSDIPALRLDHPVSDLAFRGRLNQLATSYISAHPFSLVAAFYWNGLSRLWDVRHQARALDEVRFEGRSRLVSEIGLDVYYVFLPLALVGLFRARRRRDIVLPLAAMALAASVVFTIDAGTRYRAPFEPVIALLACAALLARRERAAPRPTAAPSAP